MPKKQIERICKNCKLFNPEKSECNVIILFEGQKLKLPVNPKDPCFYEEEYFDPLSGEVEKFGGSVEQVKFWVENEKGEKIDGKGIVKIEYPEGFFGPNLDSIV